MNEEYSHKKLIHKSPHNEFICKETIVHLVCHKCKSNIQDEFYLSVASRIYHESCLQCDICHGALAGQTKCFRCRSYILCPQDFNRYIVNKCAKCCRCIHAQDWVRRACQYVFHLTCFSCNKCGRQLATGEEYALDGGRILCKIHVVEPLENQIDVCKPSETKRIRTAFTLEQLEVLQKNFKNDPNPDGRDLEWIAQIAGLSKRVTQIWFQNTRARQKKIHCHKSNQNKSSSSDEEMNTFDSTYKSDNSVYNLVKANTMPKLSSLFKHRMSKSIYDE